jgi:hypothetical protein
MSYTKLVSPILNTPTVAFTISGSAPAGTIVLGQWVPDPTQPSYQVDHLTAPPDETLIVTNMYTIVQSPAVDGFLRFKLNDKDQGINFGPLSQTYPNLFNSLKLKNSSIITINPNGVLKTYYVTSAANSSTTSVTVTVNVEIRRIPIDYKGPISL